MRCSAAAWMSCRRRPAGVLAAMQAWCASGPGRSASPAGEIRFSRAEVREATGLLRDTQCRLHLDGSASLEYLLVHRGRRGQSFEYELLFDGAMRGRSTASVRADRRGLASFCQLRSKPRGGPKAGFAGSSRGQNAAQRGAFAHASDRGNPEACQRLPGTPMPAESHVRRMNGSRQTRKPLCLSRRRLCAMAARCSHRKPAGAPGSRPRSPISWRTCR